jgi:hypothetical protein
MVVELSEQVHSLAMEKKPLLVVNLMAMMPLLELVMTEHYIVLVEILVGLT